MSLAVILLGGGAGARLGAGPPKAFVEVRGRSLLSRAAETASAARVADLLLVVAPEGWELEAQRAAAGYGLPVRAVRAGPDRADSVRRALEDLSAVERVVCHDVARPLASAALFRAVTSALTGVEGVVPVVPVTETVKRVDDGMVVETLPRDDLAQVQTPQAFDRAALLEAHAALAAAGAGSSSGAPVSSVGDAALLQAAGHRVTTVPGDPANVKVTHRHDLAVIEAMIRARDGG